MSGIYDDYEEAISTCQELSFETLEKEFAKLKLELSEAQKADLGLVNADGKYTNLALLLSEQCCHSIKVARFEKITQRAVVQQEFSGSVLKQFNEAYYYISKSCNGLFWGKDSDFDAPYPGKSLEESLLNSIIHRNYNIPDSILVKCFPNYIEVISPGGIPRGFSLGDITQGISILRNPKLAAIFKKLNLVELLGGGIQHIIRPYAVKPQIKVTENVFKVQIFDNFIYGFKELSARDKMIIEYLLDNQTITRANAAELLGVELQTAARELKHLLENKALKRIDKGKETKYMLYNSEHKVEEEPPSLRYIDRIC